jgi:hypothetical protein
MKRVLRCWSSLVALVPVAVFAADAAKGVFLGNGVEVPVADAYAHLGKARFGDDRVIHVHLSTQPLDRAAIDASLDREAAFLEQAAAHSPEMTLHFDPQTGKWRGTIFNLGSGNNCGYCSAPDVPGGVLKVEGGILEGHLDVKPTDGEDGDRAGADLRFALPIAAELQTVALDAGGGEPGKAFMACLDAVVKKDATAFGTYCGIPMEGLDEGQDPSEYVWMKTLFGRKGLKLSGPKVTGGRASDAAAAELFVEGRDSGRAVDLKGSVYMKKTSVGWVYVSEKLERVE